MWPSVIDNANCLVLYRIKDLKDYGESLFLNWSQIEYIERVQIWRGENLRKWKRKPKFFLAAEIAIEPVACVSSGCGQRWREQLQMIRFFRILPSIITETGCWALCGIVYKTEFWLRWTGQDFFLIIPEWTGGLAREKHCFAALMTCAWSLSTRLGSSML